MSVMTMVLWVESEVGISLGGREHLLMSLIH